MIYLILDTNNWIYLANGLDQINSKYHDNLHFELLHSLKELTTEGKIQILINDIILTEWNRNKEHCNIKIKGLENKLLNKENAFKDIIKYTKTNVRQLQDEYVDCLESEIQLNKKHIQNVEDFLLNDCLKVEITQELKQLIFDLAINNEAPFHNKKNNVGDAAILLSSVEFLKNNKSLFGDSAIFISNNIEEYTDGINVKSFHPQLKKLLQSIDIGFERVLPSALNISKKIIEEMDKFIVQLANLAEEQFTWDIDRKEKGTLMFLDVEYFSKQKERIDFLTLCVAKNNGEKRPKGISFILPNYLNKTNCIFLFFTNNIIDKETKDFKFILDQKSTIRLHFEDITEDTCTARIWNGYSTDEESGLVIDIFQKFLEFDSMIVMYFNEDMTHQSISVPLFSFRQQYYLIPE
jgi:hypothetical protein